MAPHFFDEASHKRFDAAVQEFEVSRERLASRVLSGLNCRKADGTMFVCDVRLLTRSDVLGPVEILALFQEVSRYQEPSRTVEKAVYGLVCCELVHDFNNMLEVILGNLHLASTRSVDDKCRDLLASAETACWHGAQLVRSLLRSERGDRSTPEVVALGGYLNDLWPLIVAIAGQRAGMSRTVQDENLRIRVDRTAFDSAILNLVVNARNAIMRSSGCSIRLEARATSFGPESMTPGDARYAGIYIIDDGPGIPSEIIPSLFDPFFTTDQTGKGSGLGLSMVKRFTEAHGGHVTVESSSGHGTTVGILLPMV